MSMGLKKPKPVEAIDRPVLLGLISKLVTALLPPGGILIEWKWKASRNQKRERVHIFTLHLPQGSASTKFPRHEKNAGKNRLCLAGHWDMSGICERNKSYTSA